MSHQTPTEIIDLTENLHTERSTFESHWAETAPLVLTRQDDFFNTNRRQGEKRNQKKFDDTASLANERFAAAMESILTPRSSRWHALAVGESLEDNHEVKLFTDNLTSLLFKIRYAPKANFASQQHENYMGMGAFGNAVLILEDIPGFGIRYKSSHISEHHFLESFNGLIETDYRKYRLTALKAMQRFPDVELPQVVRTAADKDPSKRFWFIQCVKPNDDHIAGSRSPRHWKFISQHVCVEGKVDCGTGFFRTFPFIISRYVTAPNEVYGRGPAMSALAEIKMLNAMRKSDLRARHMAIDPPHAAINELSVRRFQMKPNHINYGALDENGNFLIKPMENNYKGALSNDIIDQSREVINDTFLVSLFQILVDTPAMTATEVLQRAQEKGSLLSPTMGRQQSESLGPMIEREIDILDFNGTFDPDGILPMPQALRDAGGELDIEYTSPLNRMQKSEEALAAQRTVDAAIPLAALDPTIMDVFNWDEYVDIVGDANGAPTRLFHAPEQVEATRQSRAEQQGIQQAVEAAPQVAGAIKDISQAQAFSEG